VTADLPLPSFCWVEARKEIVTPEGTDLAVWDALTGDMKASYPKVVPTNITALAAQSSVPAGAGTGFGGSKRRPTGSRIFVGTEAGNVHVLNAASGQFLKALVQHSAEIVQIETNAGHQRLVGKRL
jgi:hypothetical protein